MSLTQVRSDRYNRISASPQFPMTVKNLGATTVFFGTEQNVSSSLKTGELAENASTEIKQPTYFIAKPPTGKGTSIIGSLESTLEIQSVNLSAEQSGESHVWNAASFPGASDTTKIKEAVAECKTTNTGYVWLGAKAGWTTTETIIVPSGVRVSGAMFGLRSKVEATGNYPIFTCGEAGDSSEIVIEYLFLRAKTEQTSGGGFEWATNGTMSHIHHIRFGSNLKIGINLSGFLLSATWLTNLVWNDGATQPKGCGTAIKLGDGTTLVNQIRIRDCECIAATTADMKVGLDLNFVDTVSVADSIFEVMEVGIQAGITEGGSTSTGIKFTNVVVDTTKGHGWNLGKVRDVELVNCNAQTCGTKLVGVGVNLRASKGVRINGGTIQHNENHGFVAETGAEDFMLDGVNVTDNNMANEGGSGIVIAAAVSKWKVSRCESGNFYGLSGKQQFGILVEAGASKDFQIVDNVWNTNESGTIENKGTGANQTIARNSTIGGNREWAAKVKRKTGEEITASAKGDTLVSLVAEVKTEKETELEVKVNGVVIAKLWSAKQAPKVPINYDFIVPASLKYELKVAKGELEPAEYETSYLAL